MIIIIKGKQGEGKTSLAKKICNGKKTSFIAEYSLKFPFWTNEIYDDTEFIVVDDVKNYDETYKVFRHEILTINRRCESPVNIKMPNVIFILHS